MDSLQAFLNFYFADRESTDEYIPILLDEIINYNNVGKGTISFKTLLNAYEEFQDCLAIDEISNSTKMDEEEIKKLKKGNYKKFKELSDEIRYFNQIGAIRVLLCCYFDDYEKFMSQFKKESIV